MTTNVCQIDKTCEIASRRYFEAFNTNSFETAAALFASDGQLQPPFDSPIVGPAAIAQYLKQEASQMTAYPDAFHEYSAESRTLQVTGQVDAMSFKVGVEWRFSFTSTADIKSLSVRLRASMKELLAIRPN